MERLLKDAEKLSGVKYDIKNLGDVYDAIHVIQGELGLTGVAAAEAKTTFTGSMGAMKASAQNLLASMATGQDVSGPLTSLLESTGNFLINNLVPMLANVVMAIPPAFVTLLTKVVPQIGTAFQNAMAAAPGVIESGTQMINNLINGIIAGLPGFIQMAFTAISAFVNGILTNLPTILLAGSQIILNLVNGLIQNLPQIVTTAYSAMMDFVAGVMEKLPEIYEQGIEIIAQLAAGLIEAIPDLVGKIPEIYDSVKQKFMEFDWLQLGKDILKGIGKGLSEGGSILWDAAKSAASGLLGKFKGYFNINSPSRLMADEVGKWIPAGIALGIDDNIGVIDSAIRNVSQPIYNQTSYLPGEAYSIGEDISKALTGASENQNVTVNVTLAGDTAKLFKVIEKTNTARTKATNYNVLAYR